MRLRLYGTAFLGLGLALGAIGEASATVITCQTESPAGTTSPDYICLNGTETLPGTNVGTVGSAAGDVNEIGNIPDYNSGTGGAYVNPTNNPSIYEFTWGGGNLEIQEALGNNGTETAGVDVELALESGTLSVNSNGSLSTYIASINFSAPFVYDAFKVVYDGSLAAGNYALDTYAGIISVDPNYQVDFSFPTSSVPEPSSLAVLVVALAGLPLFARRRKA